MIVVGTPQLSSIRIQFFTKIAKRMMKVILNVVYSADIKRNGEFGDTNDGCRALLEFCCIV